MSSDATFDSEARPRVFSGSDDTPLMLGITSKSLMRVLNRASGHIFHINATFKLTLVEYPVVVCGVTDSSCAFHLAALFIVLQLTTNVQARAFGLLQQQYKADHGRLPAMRYCMGDADKAQQVAYLRAGSVHDDGVERTYLKCYYHVLAAVEKNLHGKSDTAKALVFGHISMTHLSPNEGKLQRQWRDAQLAWSMSAELATFVTYFELQWVLSSFRRWQCSWTPSGRAKTNNPVEKFNTEL